LLHTLLGCRNFSLSLTEKTIQKSLTKSTMNMEDPCLQNLNAQKYKGVRKRKWGKWVSEIREPGKKTRIWLGSYEVPEMAAAAYDVAALHLRGRGARLNFPELLDSMPRPKSSRAEDVQLAAQEAALRLRRPGPASVNVGSSGGNVVPVRVGLSPSQIQAINESPMDSPKMWMELAMGALLLEESDDMVLFDNDVDQLSEWEEVQYESIWDS
jgi:hypothetical protein